MISPFVVEQQASRLRANLRHAHTPELKLLCGLQFFALFGAADKSAAESYVREFGPALSVAAVKANPSEFLPHELEQLQRTGALFRESLRETSGSDEAAAVEKLIQRAQTQTEITAQQDCRGNEVCVMCLFVEHYPDLELDPRGRILNLYVSVDTASSKLAEDDIVVRNPVDEPDDRFLAQARSSVVAARSLLYRRHQLSQRKRYRIDYRINTTGVRYTGDSLGLAFAVGAVAALSRLEVLRESWSIAPDAAFSGALNAEGQVQPVDSQGLKLKIYRAIHSGLRCLVIPREHMSEAWAYLSEIESGEPENRMELVGAETLPGVVTDPRLLPAKRCSLPIYAARRLGASSRSMWIEVPALLLLLAVFAWLVLPDRYMPWFDDNPARARVSLGSNAIVAFNAESQVLWADTIACRLTAVHDSSGVVVVDLDRDGKNEVLWAPAVTGNCEGLGRLYCYTSTGSLRFERECGIVGQYPGDDTGTRYQNAGLWVCSIDDSPVIVTTVSQEVPARCHIQLWDKDGNERGWYINSGHAALDSWTDIDFDGDTELLFVAFNNRLKQVALLIVDPESMVGVSPPYFDSYYDLTWVRRGTQESYITFPVTDVGEIDLPTEYNSGGADGIEFSSDGALTVPVVESRHNCHNRCIKYRLVNKSSSLRVDGAVLGDGFIKRRADLVKVGLLPEKSRETYQAELANDVTYWLNGRWVREGDMEG